MMDSTYKPEDIEQKHYARWEESGAFNCDPQSDKKPYCIMIPPPNVTGSLHMGHALTFTVQDILIRYHRMKGFDVLWQSGTDHAGIATQMVVERQLAEQGVSRHDLGREKFIEKVWEWKATSGGMITNQLRRLGASLNWSRERFTMDEGLSSAVIKTFVDLYNDGLIYKDKRLVNWDPKLLTAISDLEVEQKEINSFMWYFNYPLEDGSGHITIATTRPETMLGDVAIAVHPDDDRYKKMVGKKIKLPLVGRLIPIVADEYSDPEKGSGAVKITPAHDFNDFEVGKRHNLEMISVLDEQARINENAPKKYQGLDRYDARKQIVADLEELGLVKKIEPHVVQAPFGDRGGVVIEPFLTDQWYVNAEKLSKEALAAVRDGRTKFVPQNWEKTYFQWLENIQPWCISRQLWWGHQIPAWYGPDGKYFVAQSEDEAAEQAEKHYGKKVELTRDPDVLDTWFSSQLWPFSTLGWPDETSELKKYYPTSVLVTGFDIIFFWVARMMMAGLHLMHEVPFKDVYIHALVRDEKGQKMSKSKGNVIDPLEVMEQYGADALRFTLASMAAQGRDIKMAVGRVEGYRNFATKLWNAARFTRMNASTNESVLDPKFDPADVNNTVNQWLVAEVARVAQTAGHAIESYRFNEAANILYQFIWGTFCDWYLEFTKPIMQGDDTAAIAETRATTAWGLDQILIMLHPIMPFITEELWGALADRDQMLITTSWPEIKAPNTTASQTMNNVVELITLIRSVRVEMNVPAAQKIRVLIKDADPEKQNMIQENEALILKMARLATVEFNNNAAPKGSAQAVWGGAMVILPLADVIDLDAERARIQKQIAKLDDEIQKIEKKLNNQGFMAKAPEEVVVENREKLHQALEAKQRLDEVLSRLAV